MSEVASPSEKAAVGVESQPPEVRTVIGATIHGTYGTARGIAELFAFVGWAIVAVGVLVAILGFGAGAPFNFVAAGLGIGVAAVGLLLVAAEQVIRATVDSADYSRQALLLQIGLAQGRAQISLDGTAVKGTPAGSSTVAVTALPNVEGEFEYKGRRIVKRGNDYFVEGSDQPYNSLYTARLIIDRGDVNR